MPVTQREIWESCQQLPRIVLFHLNSPHVPPKADLLLYHHLNRLTLHLIPSLWEKQLDYFWIFLEVLFVDIYEPTWWALGTSFKARRVMRVWTQRLCPKLPRYHQVHRSKEEGRRFLFNMALLVLRQAGFSRPSDNPCMRVKEAYPCSHWPVWSEHDDISWLMTFNNLYTDHHLQGLESVYVGSSPEI